MKYRNAVAFFLVALLALANACHKDPTPSPDNPNSNDTTQTIYPDTIFVPFEWDIARPNMDTIRFYAGKPGVKVILMDMAPIPYAQQLYMAGWTWRKYNAETDSLYKRYDIAPDQVRARGDLYVSNFLTESTQYWPGIMPYDSARLSNLGIRLNYFHMQK